MNFMAGEQAGMPSEWWARNSGILGPNMAQVNGGLLGNVNNIPVGPVQSQKTDWGGKLGLLGAVLQDANANLYGQGKGGNVDAFQQKHQDDAFKADIQAAVGPDGKINRDALMAAFVKHGKDPMQVLGLQMQQENRAEDRNWQVQDRNTARQQQVEDMTTQHGWKQEDYKQSRADELADRNTLTAAQKAQIDIDRARLNLSRQEAGRGPAAPSGYRYTLDGKLEFIPGGPADPAVAGRGTGKPTEDQAKNTQLYARSKEQLKILVGDGKKDKGTFDQLAMTGNQIGSMVPGTTYFTSTGYQRADGALKDIAASYLYSVSGATANPGEVANLADTVRPKPGDSAQTIADKKARVSQMVESIKMRATPQLLNQPSGGGDAPQQTKTIGGKTYININGQWYEQ